jgi:hypothetical protein
MADTHEAGCCSVASSSDDSQQLEANARRYLTAGAPSSMTSKGDKLPCATCGRDEQAGGKVSGLGGKVGRGFEIQRIQQYDFPDYRTSKSSMGQGGLGSSLCALPKLAMNSTNNNMVRASPPAFSIEE